MTKHIALIALPFVLSILCPQIFAQQKYQLEIATDKSSYEFTTHSSSNISFEVAGQNNNIDQSVLIKQGLQIFPGNKTGEFDLKYTMNRMDMTVKVQNIPYTSISTNDPTNSENKALKAIIDKPIFQKIDHYGSPIGSADLSKVVKALDDVIPGMSEYFLNSLRSNFQCPINLRYPTKPIGIGESWETRGNSYASGNGVQVQTDGKIINTLKNVDNKYYYIEQVNHLTMSQNGIQFAGAITTLIKVDRNSGILKESTGKGILSGEGMVQGKPYRAKTRIYYQTSVEKK